MNEKYTGPMKPVVLQCNHCGEQFPAEMVHECSYKKLKSDNEKLRQALRFYADRRHYHREYDPFERTYEPSSLDMDFGRKAEQALEDRK